MAAIISPGLDGNLTVIVADNGPNTVVANGGTDTTPEIIIQNGVSLTGDSIIQNAVVINAPNYTLNNNGSLSGALSGVVANDSTTLVNYGTIQTTALAGNAYRGSVGVDSLVLNQNSALLGNVIGGGGLADSITFNGGLSTPGGSSNVIRGNVLGFDTITKGANGGVAFIGTVADENSGLNVTANNIQINGGGLYINADVAGNTTPLTTINANGSAIGGTGVWSANLNVLGGGFSAGAIPINLDSNPANSVGLVTVNGSVTHSANTFIRVDVIPNAVISPGVNSDLIRHTQDNGGLYNVSGMGVRLSPTNINRVITPGNYTVIDSNAAIPGFANLGPVGVQFNDNVSETGYYTATGSGANYLESVLTNYFVTPFLANGGTDLALGVNYDFGDLPGLSPNESALGGALDTLALRAGTGTLGADEQDLIAALSLSDLPSVQASLAALNPESSLILATSVVNSNYRLHRMVQDHLAFTRNGSVIESYSPGSTTRDAKGGIVESEPVRQTSTSNGNFWGAISYDQQDYEGNDFQSDFDGDVAALTVGVDFRVSELFLLGALVDASKGDLDHSLGRGSDIDSLRGAIYGTYGASKGVYSDFLVGYGAHEFDHSRSNGVGVFPAFTDSGYDSDSLQALFTIGYAMGTEQLTHGPFLGAEYQQLNIDGFNQGGGPVFVNDHEIESLRGLIGYRLNANYGAFRPYASVAYAHEFEDGLNNATASIGGTSFDVAGAELQSVILATAGFGYAFTDQLMMDLGYRGEIPTSGDGMTSHGVSLGLNYSF